MRSIPFTFGGQQRGRKWNCGHIFFAVCFAVSELNFRTENVVTSQRNSEKIPPAASHVFNHCFLPLIPGYCHYLGRWPIASLAFVHSCWAHAAMISFLSLIGYLRLESTRAGRNVQVHRLRRTAPTLYHSNSAKPVTLSRCSHRLGSVGAPVASHPSRQLPIGQSCQS